MQSVEGSSLAHCKALKGAGSELVARLEAAADWHSFDTGEQLCKRGDPGDSFMFLAQGKARVLIHAPSGQEVAFADVEAGGHFGELSLVDGGVRSATVVAADPCIAAAVERALMLDVISVDSRVALNLLEDFARILRGSNDRVVDLSTKSGVQRVYDELLRLAEPTPSGDGSWYIPTIPMHKEIAVWAGTTTDTVARAIGQLTNVGIVKRRNRSLHIIDRRHIEKLASSGEAS
jgi:CRP-like cAMP-binding protein